MSNYGTKTDLKSETGVDTSSFAIKIDLASLKSNVDKLNIDKLKNVPTNLNNLKSKVDKLDISNLPTNASLNAKDMRLKVKYLVLLTQLQLLLLLLLKIKYLMLVICSKKQIMMQQ